METQLVKRQAIEDFKNNLDRVYDPDFGDYKRKCGNYIMRLAPHFLDNSDCFEILKDLKQYVVFNDNLRTPEEVRFYIDQKVNQLEDKI